MISSLESESTLTITRISEVTPISLVFDGGCHGNDRHGYGSFVLLNVNWDPISVIQERDFGPQSTNNVAEWLTLEAALQQCLTLSFCGTFLSKERIKLFVLGDSMLVIRGAAKSWKVRAPHLRPIAERVWALAAQFPHIEFKWWARENSVRVLGH